MIRVDSMYKTLHLVNFKIINTDKLINLKKKGLSDVKRSNIKIYINKPLHDRDGRINKKHLLYLIKIRDLLIKGIKEIQKEIKSRNDKI